MGHAYKRQRLIGTHISVPAEMKQNKACAMRCLLGSPLLGTICEVGTVCTLHTWVPWFSVGVPSRHQVHHTRHLCPLYWKYI